MKKLIVQKDPKSPVSEAYRTLRTNIQFASFDKKIQTLLITSAGPSEGKSTTAANIALTMAESGNKVLLIDCDLRKPSIHRQFNISNIIGLSNFLVGEADFDKTVNKFSEDLYILTSGKIPPNPSEMLSSHKMKNFIESQKNSFDYIILDTPPVIAVTDSQILSTMVDGVLFVVSSNQAERDAAIKAKNLLLNVKANIIGVVLNKVDLGYRSGYGYGYGYYNYFEEDKKKGRKRK